MKRCLIVDGNSILNRAFYGIRPLTTKTGKHTNAIFGMCNILFRQIDAIKPDYVAVAFDLKAPNFRKERFPAYKEGRHPTPPELSSQFPDAKAFLRVLGFHVLELAGYEADDILGTLAELAKKTPDTHTYILSGDRDLLQLIDDKTSVLLVTTGDTPTYNRNLFFEKYGVEPHELVAVKALMGDSSDNIPGVAGVGEKTALKLIAEYHTLDNIYANIEDKIIKPGVREKLLRDREMAELSYFLATIACDAPLNLALEDIRRKEFDKQALYQKCIELEFYAFIKKFNLNPAEFETAFAETSDAPTTFVAESTTQETDANQISTSDLNENHMPSQSSASRAEENAPVYQVVDAKKLIASLLKTFAVTHDATLAHPFSFYDGKHAFLYDGELAQLAELFGGDYTVICVDGKAFLHQCYDANLSPNFTPQDILLASYVLNPSSGNATFPSLAMQFLGQSLKADGGNANLAFELFSLLLEKIKEAKSEKVLCDIELPLAPILCRMERFGFKLDIKGLSAFGETLCKTMDALRENIFMHAGEHFNINSPKQLSEVLFQKLLLPTEKSKKNRNGFSTDVEVLQSLRHMHPIIEDILDYRQIAKLYSTYVQGLLKVADENGRVHTDFKQSLTATGRLSSAEPNLQNIPIRTKLGRELRRFFITSNKDYLLVDADYSQIELRLLAAMSGDPTMIEAFNQGEDIHTATAAAVFHLPKNMVNSEMRKRAKAVNFGIVYGIGAFSLAQDLHISVAEAKRYIENYFKLYPTIKDYLDQVVEDATLNGFTTTLFGRRRYIPELSASNKPLRAAGKRVAMNSPLQGTAADIIKIAMIAVDRRLQQEKLDAHLFMQVHDELIIEAHHSCADKVASILTEEMEKAANLAVTLTATVSIHENWFHD